MKRAIAFAAVVFVLAAIGRITAGQSLSVYEVGFRTLGSSTKTDLYRFQDDGSMVSQRSLPDTRQGVSMTTYGGKLYVAELSGAINEYDLSGAFLAHFADVTAQTGIVSSSPRLESDSTGGLYAAFNYPDSRPSVRLDPNGNISQTFSHPNLNFPKGIDAAANRDVYILRASNRMTF
jgi:hypothetical protein